MVLEPPAMSNAFDPYHKWLGIPPAEQPPHHYRLLGVALFEADADVIESAADQRMAHVRSFQTGKHSAESQRILNELAAARRCLLDARQRVTYDDGLRLRFDEAEPFHAAIPVAVGISQHAVGLATVEPIPFVADRPVRPVRRSRGLSSRSLAWVMCAAVVVSALAWIGPMILKAKSQRGRAAQDAQRVPVVKAPTLDKERSPVKETQTPPVVEPPLPEKESPPITNTRPRTAKSQGRYVRVELPRVGTLSLVEVEVYSDGRNIAPAGKASQTNVAYGGEAAMAIDGETSGVFPEHPGTHTEHDVSRPWWEVDLGATRPLDKIVVFNRTDCCGERLEGFTLTVLDEKRRTVAQRTGIPAPQSSVAFDLRIDADGKVQLDALSGKQTLVLESQNAQSLSQRGGRLP
jgi:hypothetical protein